MKTLKKRFNLALAGAMLLAFAIVKGACSNPVGPNNNGGGGGNTESIIDKGNNLYWLDPKVTNPDDYTLITGFKLNYTVVKPGALGGEAENFQVSVIMVAKGECTTDDYEMEYPIGSMPGYRGKAEEIATHSTGAGAYVGPMVFFNCIDDGGDTGTYKEVGIGSKIEWTYTGTTPLFDSDVSIITAYGVWGAFEVTGVEWIKGNIVAGDPTENWSPVASKEYLDIPTVADGGNGYNYIDITVPDQGGGPFPVIFWIHGGGWTTLNRKSVIVSDTKQYMLYKGYAWVSAEYTLATDLITAPGTGWPQMMYDLKHALRWLRAHGSEYNLNTNYVVTMGESAGGHLALMLGTTNGNTAYEDTTPGYEDYSSDIQAMVSYYGGITLAAQFFKTPEADPTKLITADCPPVFLTHGENDQTAPIANTYAFEKKYKEVVGNPDNITTLYYGSGPHGSRAVFDSSQTMARVKNFVIGHNPSVDYGIDDKGIVNQWKHNSTDNVSITFSVDGTFFMSGENQGTYTLANKRLTMNITTLNLTITGDAVINGDGTLTVSQINNTNFSFLNGAYTAVKGIEGGIKIDDERIFGRWKSSNPELGELVFTADGYINSTLPDLNGWFFSYTLQETVMKTNLYGQLDEGTARFTDDDTLVLEDFTESFVYFNGAWTRVAGGDTTWILGTWTGLTSDTGTFDITFNDNGTYSTMWGYLTGTYTLNGSALTLTVQDYPMTGTAALDDGKLVMSGFATASGGTMPYLDGTFPKKVEE